MTTNQLNEHSAEIARQAADSKPWHEINPLDRKYQYGRIRSRLAKLERVADAASITLSIMDDCAPSMVTDEETGKEYEDFAELRVALNALNS